MASQPGEERLLTVFADVHYYFSAPTPRPLLDRFDTASYLYLHGNVHGRGARLEVANHVGRAEQDAFTGSLDTAVVRQSYKHPTLCTVTVEGYQGRDMPSTRPEVHWKLPTGSEPRRGPQQLHTVDIYFWTSHDADNFVDSLKRLLEPNQLQLLDFPPTPAANDTVASPVVQKLESLAVRDQQDQRNSRISRTDSASLSQVSSVNPVESNRSDVSQQADPASFKPMAYNPAAPAAPEPIAHREKTPPPIDAEQGTGLVQAATSDRSQTAGRPPYGLSHPSSGYIGGPPSFPGSPPSALNQRTPTFPGPPSQPQSTSTQSFAPPPSQALVRTETESSQQSYSVSNSGQPTPASEILGNSYVGGHHHQPLQHLQPQYADYLSSGHQSPPSHPASTSAVPIAGGYSNYQYSPTPSQQQNTPQAQGDRYAIHNEVYRPTEEEFAKMKPKRQATYEAQAGPGQQGGKLEDRAQKVDKSVNKFFKKLEKRIG